jgi:hypothetical protein
MSQKVAITTLDVFDDSKQGSQHDHDAGNEEHQRVLAPRDVGRLASSSGTVLDTVVEHDCDDHEEAEEEELNDQATDDYVFAHIFRISFLFG